MLVDMAEEEFRGQGDRPADPYLGKRWTRAGEGNRCGGSPRRWCGLFAEDEVVGGVRLSVVPQGTVRRGSSGDPPSNCSVFRSPSTSGDEAAAVHRSSVHRGGRGRQRQPGEGHQGHSADARFPRLRSGEAV